MMKNNRFVCVKPYVRGKTVSYTVTSTRLWFLRDDTDPIRPLTTKEAASLQTLPKSIADVANLEMIANAVPPAFAYRIAKCFL